MVLVYLTISNGIISKAQTQLQQKKSDYKRAALIFSSIRRSYFFAPLFRTLSYMPSVARISIAFRYESSKALTVL